MKKTVYEDFEFLANFQRGKPMLLGKKNGFFFLCLTIAKKRQEMIYSDDLE